MTTAMADRFARVHAQIATAERLAGRDPGSVNLLAVSKTKPAAMVAAAYRLGQRHFGENYVQEARLKQIELAAFNITWHFIGPLQSNKTKLIASHFDWVHSVDKLRIAQRLSEQRPEHLPPLNVCLQVNISAENSKSGIPIDELPQLAAAVAALPRLRLRGVMAIPEPTDDYDSQRHPYRCLYQAVHSLSGFKFDAFSYGMSADLQAAIVEGATWVRIGSALFGAR